MMPFSYNQGGGGNHLCLDSIMHDHELHNYVALPSKMPRVLMQGFFLVESNHSMTHGSPF